MNTIITIKPVGGYRTILADPPWRYKSPGWKGGADRHYPTLPVEAIKELPISLLAAEDAHLWLWTTDTFLEDTFKMIVDWGFEKKATFEWVKLTKKPLTKKQKRDYELKLVPTIKYQGVTHGIAWGNGYYARSCSEFLILATRGKNLVDDKARQVRKVFFAPIGEHSEKPEESYRLIRNYSPGPRLELFARTKRTDFTIWGNEVNEKNTIPELDNWSDWATREYPEKRRN